MKIFYHPITLGIMGASDGEDSMNYPFVESDEQYHSLTNLQIEMGEDGIPALSVTQNTPKKMNGFSKPRAFNKINNL